MGMEEMRTTEWHRLDRRQDSWAAALSRRLAYNSSFVKQITWHRVKTSISD